MSTILPRRRLNRVAQAKRNDILAWKEGVSLERDSALEIAKLMCVVAADRWNLAKQHRGHAHKLFHSRPPQNRSAISRYYYSMYHATRACVYISHGGDDHQEHSELPLHIPSDFDPTTNWQAKLKDARLVRNNADYDTYPKSDTAWRKPVLSIKQDADLLLQAARRYLIQKGCRL